ncbi:MAG: cupin domain-containing protein [Dehalococcoidia bacterium]
MNISHLDDLKQRLADQHHPYLEFLREPSMTAGLYRLAAGATDHQQPHTEDEIYFVVEGRARVSVDGDQRDVGPGDVIFVRKNVEHRFSEITEALLLLVLFAPPEAGD